MTFEFLKVERAGHVATVTMNRPDKLNALNADVVRELGAAFEEAARAGDVRAAVLTGAGRAFVAGADIAAMSTMTPVEARRFAEAGQAVCARIEALSFPVIAAVNGFALGGGCELALSCDFIYAADAAKFGQPEVTLGVLPGFGGTQRLLRRVGIAKARELVFTGDVISAEQALAIGLANAVVPAADLVAKTAEVAAKIASRGPLAVAASKRVMRRGAAIDLDAACDLEAEAFAGLFGSEDQRGGMKAFLEKAKPTFTGR